ncbi:ATP-binding protein [Glacieibacterium frigidum]|uniref:histidine kinase n=1 Tax=Glacieibacterium frigidum TaxID=2593303 RepID=A0A552U8L8_9SPHN|nr:ATP-binding protein [Glacieibacterium frigidum]TRW14568.1 HAMP domain-containing protein [Glacieibacterium frigidum]
MSRFAPRSLAGQMALLLGIALLVAQLANFALILSDRQRLSLAQTEGPAITRFASTAADVAQAAPEFRTSVLEDASHRGARFAVAADSGIADARRKSAIEARLVDSLTAAGITVREVRAAIDGPASAAFAPPRRQRPDTQSLYLSARQADGSWLNARLTTPKRDALLPWRLAAATLLLYLLVLGATTWLARRLARPLADLTRAAEAFGGRGEPVEVTPRGPDDLRAALSAFNAMNRRLVGLLDEKDHMLGAIGHDLRTPLASLRIHVESMEPEDERAAVIARIEEMTAMLEDILVLARTGRTREALRRVDVAALAEALVEDQRALGRPVEFVASPPAVAAVQPALVKRALGNLFDNAVKYGGSATVAVRVTGDTVAVSVTDHGPGIPAADRARVLQPFHRLEGSRNRDTGGSGLGLAIAQSVAESHGGRLTLGDAHPTGLVATLELAVG